MLKVQMNEKGRVKSIDKDNQPTWVVDKTVDKVLPSIPKWMMPVINNYKPGTPLDNKIEVIPCSGQYWNELNFRQQGKLLELVEYLGGDSDQYVKDFEKMYPRDHEGKR